MTDPGPTALPADACPYPKPFAAGFDGCPAFQPSHFTALDTQYQLIGSVRTCTHLEVGAQGSRNAAFYPRCGLGDEGARRRWATEVQGPRLAALTGFRVEYGAFAAPHMESLWAAKGRLMEALRGTDREIQAVRRRELDEAVEEFLIEVDAFMDGHRARLEELGLPLEASRELIGAAFEHWKRSSAGLSDYQVPEELMARFPPHARILLRPRGND